MRFSLFVVIPLLQVICALPADWINKKNTLTHKLQSKTFDKVGTGVGMAVGAGNAVAGGVVKATQAFVQAGANMKAKNQANQWKKAADAKSKEQGLKGVMEKKGKALLNWGKLQNSVKTGGYKGKV